jgi:DNA polymerase-1
MTYEEYLIAVRADALDPSELTKLHKLKGISSEIEHAENLRIWVDGHGGVQYVQTEAAALEALAKFDLTVMTGIDIETSKLIAHPMAGLLPAASRIRLVQLWQPTQPVVVVDCFTAGTEWLHAVQNMKLVAHNSVFETKHLVGVMGSMPPITCSMLMMRPFVGRNLGLVATMKEVNEMLPDDFEAADALGIELSKALQVSDWARLELLTEQIDYAAADAIAACLLHGSLTEVYTHSDLAYSSANDLLQRMVPVVANQSPIWLDLASHAELVTQWDADVVAGRLDLAAQGLYKPQSTQAKQAWLTEMLSAEELASWITTEKGNLSTSKDVILQHAPQFPTLKTLADFTRMTSLNSNFGVKLSGIAINGEIHASYRIAGAVTGRFACSQPNLQNIPKAFRHLFTAPKGWKLVTGDLSQIELRVAGILAGETVINEAYRNGEDLHKVMGAKLAGVPVEQVTKQMRQQAKAANFGLVFGAGAKTLRNYASVTYGIEMSLEQAETTKRAFHSLYPTLTAWQQRMVADTNLLGYSESHHFKLRRHYSKEVYTHAMNFPVQSTAAEILMVAMLYIHERLPADGGIKVCLTVYDELMLIAREEQLDTAALLLRDGFKHGFLTVFPEGTTKGLVGIGSGQNWTEAASDESVRLAWSL